MSGWPWQLDLTVVRDLMREVQPILDSKVVAAGVAAIIGIVTFRWQEREKLAAVIAWDWTMRHNMQQNEVPFLVVQNMGSTPAYIRNVRYFRGNWWRRPVKRPLPSNLVIFDEPTVRPAFQTWRLVVASSLTGISMIALRRPNGRLKNASQADEA